MSRSPWRSVAALVVPAALMLAAQPASCDEVSDPDAAYKITSLAGTGEHYFYPKGTKFGTYRAVQPAKGCRWRLLVPIPGQPGKFFQSSPRKAGQWNTRHKVTVKKVSDPKYKSQPRVLDTEKCGTWQKKVKVK